jgi:hypothetical protein
VSAYETNGFSSCQDYICELNIRTDRIDYEGQMRQRITQLGQQAPATLNLDPVLANILTAAKKERHERVGEAFIRRFGIEFEPTYIGKCADPKCTAQIKAIRASTDAEMKKHLTNVAAGFPQWSNMEGSAERSGMVTVRDSLNAKFAASPEKWIKSVSDEYVAKCEATFPLDKCTYELALLADKMGGEAVKIQGLNPDLKKDEIINEVIKQFRPRFQDLVARYQLSIIK